MKLLYKNVNKITKYVLQCYYQFQTTEIIINFFFLNNPNSYLNEQSHQKNPNYPSNPNCPKNWNYPHKNKELSKQLKVSK